MRIYIATSLENVHNAKGVARLLRSRGHYIVSRWHDTLEDPLAPEHTLTPEQRTQIAMNNHADLIQANALLLLIHKACRGSLVEFGIAYARGCVVAVVGQAERTLMLDLAGVGVYSEVDEIDWLKERA